MTIIHQSHTPQPWTTRSVDATRVEKREGLDGGTIRVTLCWDLRHPHQSGGEVALLTDAGFATLVHLHWFDVDLVRRYEDLAPSKRGEFDRDTRRASTEIEEQMASLAELGFTIAGIRSIRRG